MRRIAVRSLLFDRGKLIASLLGVALASTPGFVQVGLYRGFERSSSTIIDSVGGDVFRTGTRYASPSGELPIGSAGDAVVRSESESGASNSTISIRFEGNPELTSRGVARMLCELAARPAAMRRS